MYISARERKILETLLHTQRTITVKEIANMLDVSQRTVHRDLREVEKIINEFQLGWHKKAGVGFWVSGNPEHKQRLKEAIGKISDLEFSPDERKMIILSALLEANGPVKLIAMANELHVTTATVSNDLDQVEEELKYNKLSLIRKRGYGVEIVGREANKRAALSHLISAFLDPFDYIAQVKENIRQRNEDPSSTISQRLLGLVNSQKLEVIERMVQKAKAQLPHDLADSSYVGLVVHIALALERLQKGDSIKFNQSYLTQLKGTKEYKIAAKMIQGLEQSFDMDIPEDEIGYITMHLLGAKLRAGDDFLLEDSSLNTAYRAKELIHFVSDSLSLDLSENNSLLTDLVAHLKPAVFRIAQGMKINNPMTVEIKRDYEDLFQVIQEGTKQVFFGMDFPNDEIAYLVLHFASAILHVESKNGLRVLVLCSSGIGSAKMLATRLKQHVPEIHEVVNQSMFDIGDIDKDAYDLIVSTVPIKELKKNEYILVSPMLSKPEEHQVKKAVKKKIISHGSGKHKPDDRHKQGYMHFQALQGLQEYMQVFIELLRDFSVNPLQNVQDIPSALARICSILEEKGKIKDKQSVLTDLLKREEIGGLGIPGSALALFHTRSNDVRTAIFQIYELDQSLYIMGMDGKMMHADRLLMMLAPQEADDKMLEAVSFLSGSIIQSKASIKLFETGNQEEIKSYLAEQFRKNIL